MSTQQTLVITQISRKWQLTSGDFGVLGGEALGESFGDFDVDLRSAGLEV